MSSGPAPVELAHTESGKGDPVILIMGLNASGAAWRPHVDQWSRTFRCLAVDNRGAGESPAPLGPYTTAELADDYANLIRKLDLGVCRVVGISMGGAIAQELALRHPELVERLVLVATWAGADPYTRDILTLIDFVRSSADEATFNMFLQTLVWTPDWFSSHDHDLTMARQVPPSVGPDALAAQVQACLTHDTLDRLGGIAVPTLVTAGRLDRFVPIRLSRTVAEEIPGARLEIFDESGHVHHWEELQRFNDYVEEWLK
ncbi:alpha/beta hydrolase [Microlunatus panaciterrae]|uniref:Pimeloyl-ACP methyl ester carboxylesterase n=1 Tax=Microlunatus panaciterrae TaxID=400768 RepID=A0ABS2RMQ6_9ACTN|nr:alpha/beta fold hydrolase [Microlunatus panaciterrae]MBM7799471.1 pimeloyl-ACP methyl ester carboxylesterase [Microlunatus panaciterrae]